MGFEFLHEHGGRRVRLYPDQPELTSSHDPSDAVETEEAPETKIQHDYECPRDHWQAIAVTGDDLSWEEAMPRRFVDGCHVGHTVAWLQDADGHPIPLMLSEIGGVCMEQEGNTLRRAFQVVERVVALAVDPFPWTEVEDFAIALAGSGFRLLPVSLWKGGGGGDDDNPSDPSAEPTDWQASYDFEAMRRKAQNRSNYEMQVLEEVALCQNAEVPTLVDGPLEPRITSDRRLSRCPIVGVVKSHRRDYLFPRGWKIFYDLEPGERTPAFLIEINKVPVVSWYLKLDGAHGAMPTWGMVRVEIGQAYFERLHRDFGQINRLSYAIVRMRCRQGSYGRGPVSLAPIVRAEASLRSLFAPPGYLSQHFYRLTGL